MESFGSHGGTRIAYLDQGSGPAPEPDFLPNVLGFLKEYAGAA